MLHNESGFSTFFLFVARLFMSAIFILAGFVKVVDFTQTSAMMSSVGVPWSDFLLVLAILFELGGGLLLLLGWYTRFGTFLLLIFVVVVTYFFHSFWDYEGVAYVNNVYHFMKNLFIFGALLYVFIVGPGRFSLDRIRKKLE